MVEVFCIVFPFISFTEISAIEIPCIIQRKPILNLGNSVKLALQAS